MTPGLSAARQRPAGRPPYVLHDPTSSALGGGVRVDALRGTRLELEKAKAFGVHTGMYALAFDEMPHGGGTRFTFHWHRDG